MYVTWRPVAGAALGPSAGAQTAAPSFALAAQSPWVAPDGTFLMSFQAANVPPGSRVVLTHDVAQRDNLRVGRHDGVAAVIEALKGHPLFAHVTLTRSERSPVAALVTELLENLVP